MTTYPENGARGKCPECGARMQYACGTNGPQAGTWLHVGPAPAATRDAHATAGPSRPWREGLRYFRA